MKPIHSEKDYEAAVARIDALAAAPDAEQNEELELLSILVMAYEAEHVPDVPLDPVDYLRASMDNRGLTPDEFARLAVLEKALVDGIRDAEAGRTTSATELFERLEAKYRPL